MDTRATAATAFPAIMVNSGAKTGLFACNDSNASFPCPFPDPYEEW